MGLVLVDLDGTLLSGANSERRFVAHLVARRRLGTAQFAQALWFALRRWPEFGPRIFMKDKAYLAGLPVAEVAALAAAFVRDEIEPDLRPSLLRRLDHHRQSDDTIALLSGAPDFIVAPLANSLGIDLWRATRCAQREGRFLAALPLRHPYGSGKIRYAAEICAAQGVGLSDCTAYADSAADLPLLRRVARPIAVHPDRGLGRVARRQGWEVLDGPARQGMQAGLVRTP